MATAGRSKCYHHPVRRVSTNHEETSPPQKDKGSLASVWCLGLDGLLELITGLIHFLSCRWLLG